GGAKAASESAVGRKRCTPKPASEPPSKSRAARTTTGRSKVRRIGSLTLAQATTADERSPARSKGGAETPGRGERFLHRGGPRDRRAGSSVRGGRRDRLRGG